MKKKILLKKKQLKKQKKNEKKKLNISLWIAIVKC